MPWVPQNAPLTLTPDERKQLQELANSRTAPFREVQRASILLAYADGIALRRIAQEQGVTRMTVDKYIKKAHSMGVETGLKDLYHRPKDPVITPEAKAWVVSLACTKPVDLGLAAETWTRSALAAYVRTHAEEAGHPTLSKAAKATVHRILAEQELAPHKVTYYLERKDPEFDRKMREVLMVYREIVVDTQSSGPRPVHTVSVDEKPGVQALGLVSPDLSPVPGEHPSLSRDYEYVRMGTLSILSALDLHDGHLSLAGWRNGIGAGNSSPCSRIWMPTTRPKPRSGSSWTTIRPMSPRRPGPIWPPAPTGSNMCIHRSTARGSTWSRPSSPR